MLFQCINTTQLYYTYFQIQSQDFKDSDIQQYLCIQMTEVWKGNDNNHGYENSNIWALSILPALTLENRQMSILGLLQLTKPTSEKIIWLTETKITVSFLFNLNENLRKKEPNMGLFWIPP